MHTLYKLVFASGKAYIGQTVRTMNTRIAQHRRSALNANSMLPVHCAWRKHGEPIVTVLAEFDTHDELHVAEIGAIISFGTLAPNGYNVSFGGDTAPSKNPEVAEKIAKKATGRKYSDTSSFAKASIKQWEDEEYRQKVVEGVKASWTDDKRKARSEKSKEFWKKRKESGWVMSESQKEKLRNKVVTDEARRNMSIAAKSKQRVQHSEKTRAKISENTAKAWKDKSITEKRVKAIKAAWDDEARVKMGNKASESWKDPEIRARRLTAMRASRNKKL